MSSKPGPARGARAAIPWTSLATGLVLLLAGGGVVAWAMAIQGINQEIEQTRSSLKRLYLVGRVPPNEQVLEYLTTRTTALETQYRAALDQVAPAAPGAGEGNPQLYFQERVHEVQRTLERLTTAKGIDAPLQLGFPKDLPPADAVPQLLIQLKLIEDAAELIVPEKISKFVSVKVEDPQAVAPSGEKDLFLTRLPVRLRVVCSLETLTKLLSLLDRLQPLIDFQALRLRSLSAEPAQSAPAAPDSGKPAAPPATEGAKSVPAGPATTQTSPPAASSHEETTGALEVDLELSRYLALSTDPGTSDQETSQPPTNQAGASRSRATHRKAHSSKKPSTSDE